MEGEKELWNTFHNFNGTKTRDIIAKSFGMSGVQLEKAEAIVEACEKDLFGTNPNATTLEYRKTLNPSYTHFYSDLV